MQLGVVVSSAGSDTSLTSVRDVAQAADELGIGTIWTRDHLAVPTTFASRYTLSEAQPSSDRVREAMGLNLEANTTLAAMAAWTSRVRLGTSVAVLPLRNPILNARQLATIDLIAGGRVTYGIGVGWLREEAEAMGLPWENRGRRSDEHIALMRHIWACEDDDVEFNGEFWTVPPIDPRPRPPHGSIPIVIGGHSDVALERAARIGDGWIAARSLDLDGFTERVAELRRRCAAYGRDPSEVATYAWYGDELSGPEDADHLGRNLAPIIDTAREFAAAGATELRLGGVRHTADASIRWLEAVAEEVLPALE